MSKKKQKLTKQINALVEEYARESVREYYLKELEAARILVLKKLKTGKNECKP